jgi:hypothetical protein
LKTKIEPYKGRSVDHSRRVDVYRNLTRPDGPWYSVRQNGLVVGHSQAVDLHKCIFHVNEAGRQRVIRTGHKNVHAHVSGMVTMSKRVRDRWRLYDPIKARYNLRESANFERLDDDGQWRPILVTMAARLDGCGLTVWMVRAS